ncbi:MAG: selenium-binding protein SBP56-related protein [Gemmatimonadota bacterium]
MPKWRPDPTFYPSPKHAIEAPAEELAYVALIDPTCTRPDALGVVDLKPGSPTYGTLVSRTEMSSPGDELHHFGWNACSSCLAPYAPHAHVERRYLLVPGIKTSRITVLDTQPDPRHPKIVRIIDAEEIASKAGYMAPHTVHCGPDAIYINALGQPGGDGPGGVFMLDHETFDVLGPWEKDRGPQEFAYDFWWHLGHDTMVTSEWGTPNMVKDGLNPELLLAGKYGHRLHVWNFRSREHKQVIDLGKQHQMVLELRPAHDPRKAYGFAGVVISLEDLSASVFVWYLDRGTDGGPGTWKAKKVITIPAEPADEASLPAALKPFKAVPPLISDINLSVDDRFLYISCWGTGELRQYDVSDPFNPVFTGSVRIGGITGRAAHPGNPDQPLNGGPQMVEVSRDGRRVYLTNSLFTPWDEQFYPDGIKSWMVKCDASPAGGMSLDPDFFVAAPAGFRAHQVRLQGGDASSDSFCYST